LVSLLKLCCKEADTTPLIPSDDTYVTPSIDATLRSSSTETNANNTLCKTFNIRTPDKAALVMELFGEIKFPEKAPVRRQLLGGSKVLERQNEEIHLCPPMYRWCFC
jgi:hypothetical protein